MEEIVQNCLCIPDADGVQRGTIVILTCKCQIWKIMCIFDRTKNVKGTEKWKSLFSNFTKMLNIYKQRNTIF